MARDHVLGQQGHDADGDADSPAQRCRAEAAVLAMSEADAEVQRSLGRLEGKLDQALSRFAAHDSQMSALDKRVGAVEKKVWWFSGASAVIAWAATNLLGKH